MKLTYLRIAAIVLAVAACSGVESQTRPNPAAVEAARAELRASEAAHRRMRADFEGLRADGRLSQREQEDYQAYLDGLALLIEEQRVRLTALESGGPVPGHGPAGGGLTPEEEVASMDAELGGSLADFDQMLLRKAEEAKNRERRRSRDGGGASGGAAGASGEGSSQGGDAASGHQTAAAEAAAGAAGEGGEPASGATTGEGGAEHGGTLEGGGGAAGSVPEAVAAAGKSTRPGTGSTVPPDIPDGRDDDVVARQLREAAMSETDPELREKLWDEYRRYKRQGG